MRKRTDTFLALLLVLLSPFAISAPSGWTPLLSPVELAALLDHGGDIRILRISGDHGQGHIPGSVSADYADFRGPADNPGALPPLRQLTGTVQHLGLEATTPVILVHEGASPSDMGTATRVYWTLKSLGLQQLAILNGGFRAWREAGLPVSDQAVTVSRSDFTPTWHDDWRITTGELSRRIGDPALRLVDARPEAFYRGERSSIARPGTIRGSASRSFDRWFDGNRMRSPQAIRAELSQPRAGTETVSFCNTGHWASINWFVFSELAGIADTRLYAESMAEWDDARRPMANEPDRLAHYWRMTRDWVQGLWE